MLNELLIVERGAREAGVEMAQRHPDVKDVRRVPTLLVRLDEVGHVAEVRPIPSQVTPWTLRDGQHNSFPFVQPKRPLWDVLTHAARREKAMDRRADGRREAVLALAGNATFNAEAFADWPGGGLLGRVRDRLEKLRTLTGTDAGAAPAAFERFLLACDMSGGVTPSGLLREAAHQLIDNLKKTAGTEWLELASAVLIEGNGAFMFDAAGESSVMDRATVAGVSQALRAAGVEEQTRPAMGCCGLTGATQKLIDSTFPQPNLPILGQTYLFARNKDAPANDRYGRFSADSMPVGEETVIRLAAAIEALTGDARKGVTWRGIPGEAPKQTDLLLAFVETAPDAPVAAALTDEDESDEEDEPSEEAAAMRGNSVAAFEQRTRRLIEAIRAKVGKIDETPVRYAVLRKVDPANRKVSFQGQIAVIDLARAVEDWAAGERNVPQVSLPVLRKGERKRRAAGPPHVAPLGLIAFSKQLFVRGGAECQEVTGLPAGEALGLFLEKDRPRVARVLRLLLARRTALVVGTAHAYRRRAERKRELELRWEALRTVTILGLLLHKLGRRRETQEDYMNDAAFKLGQLLAAADVVHAGYCADVRGGDVPPSLLGNQVFGMAQKSPTKALDALGRRWTPYQGWATKAARAIDGKANRRRDELMRESKNREESQRGWDITKAISIARRVRPMIDELRPVLAKIPDDTFRAELLLGYIAGLPKATDDPRDTEASLAEPTTMEE